jgi:hypothetical protein
MTEKQNGDRKLVDRKPNDLDPKVVGQTEMNDRETNGDWRLVVRIPNDPDLKVVGLTLFSPKRK